MTRLWSWVYITVYIIKNRRISRKPPPKNSTNFWAPLSTCHNRLILYKGFEWCTWWHDAQFEIVGAAKIKLIFLEINYLMVKIVPHPAYPNIAGHLTIRYTMENAEIIFLTLIQPSSSSSITGSKKIIIVPTCIFYRYFRYQL
jgi:hypothetical protein